METNNKENERERSLAGTYLHQAVQQLEAPEP
jgi:hypothetical protein